jgi:signal transduction histidine kinase
MFQRLNERGQYEGSGIGLAIVKKIIERHGGLVWFDSELKIGTTFYFTIPAVQVKSP